MLENPIPERVIKHCDLRSDKPCCIIRAVLLKQNTEWKIIVCTIEAIWDDVVEKVNLLRHYESAFLYQGCLNGEECKKFLLDIDSGSVVFEDIKVSVSGVGLWRE